MKRHVLGAGVLLALVGGSILAWGSPALAADPTVSVTNLSSGDLKSGEKATLAFTVNFTPNPSDNNPSVHITVNSSIGELSCSGPCNTIEQFQAGKQYTVTLTAGGVDPGQTKTGKVTVRAEISGNDGKADVPMSVRGPDQQPTVKEVSGKVTDEKGKAVSGASVGIVDSRGTQSNVITTNGQGQFRWVGTNDRPIAPGTLRIAAVKEGYEQGTDQVNATAGQAVSVNLTMKSTVASASASASASATATAAATEDSPSAAAVPQGSAPAGLNAAKKSDDSSSGSLIFIIAGVLLVAVGIGAIVLVFIRRKENDKKAEEEEAAAAAAAAGAGAVPGQIRYADATRVGGQPMNATMVAGGMSPSLAEAPTMLQQAVPAEDEFPDPYGAPRSTQPAGYGARTQVWDGGAAIPGQAGAYGSPAGPEQQYGRPAGGYGDQPPRYDEPTGMYQPNAADGYGNGAYDGGGYPQAAPPAGGRGSGGVQPGYQSDAYPQTGPAGANYGGTYNAQPTGGNYGAAPDAGNGYGAPSPSSYGNGGYGTPAAGGAPRYDEPTSYDPRPTYGRPAVPPQGGGYEDPAYYGNDQRPPAGRPADQDHGGHGQRRSLDWLDD